MSTVNSAKLLSSSYLRVTNYYFVDLIPLDSGSASSVFIPSVNSTNETNWKISTTRRLSFVPTFVHFNEVLAIKFDIMHYIVNYALHTFLSIITYIQTLKQLKILHVSRSVCARSFLFLRLEPTVIWWIISLLKMPLCLCG